MKKTVFQILTLALIASLSAGYTGCKKKNEDPPAQEQQKTLNKATLTPKKWYNKGSSIIHEFKAGGQYGFDGTWGWVGTSDTMEIVIIAGNPKTYWKFLWNTDHEMECEKVGTGGSLLYKDQPW